MPIQFRAFLPGAANRKMQCRAAIFLARAASGQPRFMSAKNESGAGPCTAGVDLLDDAPAAAMAELVDALA